MERQFGGLDPGSDTSFALAQYFLNGGARAWVVRVAAPDDAGAGPLAKAQADVPAASGGGTAFTVKAQSEGAWGNSLRVQVLGPDPQSRFDLLVSLVTTDGSLQTLKQEVFRGLTCTSSADPNYLPTVVNGTSTLVTVEPGSGNPSVTTPAGTGLVSGNTIVVPLPDLPGRKVSATLELVPPDTRTVGLPEHIGTLEEAAAALQSGLRTANGADPRWAQAVVRLVPGSGAGDGRLQVLAGAAEAVEFTFADVGPDTTATLLELDVPGSDGAIALTGGGDGSHPGAAEIVGSQAAGSGLFALENTDFTLLCLPSIANLGGGELDPFDPNGYANVIGNAISYCRQKRALFLLDPPDDKVTPVALRTWLTENSYVRDEFSALYYPRLTIADSTRNHQPRSLAPCGTIAGLMARTDTARGVWKAPAGTEATLRGVTRLDHDLTDPENGLLNPIAVNCLRTFPAYGMVAWGSRTTAGGDDSATDYRYVPVRRLANFLESSLLIGLKWVVFEPNDEPLWSQIRLNAGSFMQGLFRQGAFAGATPKEAYLVSCDASTTTPDDQAKGVVNVLVGFAPLRPAEFVVLRIQQLAGQTQS
ncbi:phage tail sheath family protein [Streptomyces sioyaensis]|uniref:phage tail sheath family protein n=1 Tax=Streptomyces sioyaensis TaxID=67364 RepID=UPI00379109DA